MITNSELSIKQRVYRKICFLFGKIIPDKAYIKMMYYVKLGKKCNLKNPQTFDEKLNYLKLNDRNPKYSQLADKYLVRDYVAKIIGEDYLIPLLGVWENPNDISFDTLPEQFVLKCNHDSASVIICKDKSGKYGEPFDCKAAVEKLAASLRINYYYASREWPYKDIKPVVIAEQYMEDESGTELKDYKIYCFNGKPHLIQVDFGRFVHHERNLYDIEWNYIDKQIEYPKNPGHQITKPAGLGKMLELAQKLAEDIGSPSIRIDFYDINGKIYFGEITFYQEGGFAKFEPEEYGLELGKAIALNMV